MGGAGPGLGGATGPDAPGAGPGDEFDRIIRQAVEQGGSVDDVVARLRTLEGVASAEARGGLVKTEPPIIELAVSFARAPGPAENRVYDIVQELDGSLRLSGSHLA